MPTVLMLFEYPSLNGGERSALAVLDGVRGAGFEILAAAPPDGDLAERLRDVGVEVEPFHVHDSAAARRPREELRQFLATLLQRRAPDLVHANSLSMSRLSGPVVRDLRIPSIGHLRDMMNVSSATIDDLNCHTRLLAVSQATRDWYVERGLDSAKTHVLYNGVDLTVFCPRSPTGFLHRELHLPEGALLVGSIGQIGMRKGLYVTLDCAPRVLAKFPAAHFLIIGQRHSSKQEAIDYERQLERVAKTNGLAGHVHFLGRRDDVPRVMNELTLLVHAARQEPLGRVLLEAAASATPVVATEVGGTREIFSDRENARLVSPDDPGALADAINDLLDAASIRGIFGEAARRRAEQAFDAQFAASNLVEHYQELLRQGRSPA